MSESLDPSRVSGGTHHEARDERAVDQEIEVVEQNAPCSDSYQLRKRPELLATVLITFASADNFRTVEYQRQADGSFLALAANAQP